MSVACELISTCPFFNERMKVRSEILTLYRIRYCRGQHTECARYLVYAALGRAEVPADLYPNDQLQALRLVRKKTPVGSDLPTESD